MAFKSIKNYNEERFGNMFRLTNDGDTADVIFLYRGEEDVLICDAHYIKSSEYSGYVQCLGGGCPACGKNIRVQTKMFIPLYNINSQKVEFWDRNITFENQFRNAVLNRYANPSEYVFRITRHGVARSIDTTYDITAVSNNTVIPYDEIMKRNNFIFPDFFGTICKEYSATELARLLTHRDETALASEYNAVARPSFDELAEDGLPASNYSVNVNSASNADNGDKKYSRFSNDAEEVDAEVDEDDNPDF